MNWYEKMSKSLSGKDNKEPKEFLLRRNSQNKAILLNKSTRNSGC